MLRPVKCAKQISCLLTYQLEVLGPNVKSAISSSSQHIFKKKTLYCLGWLAPQHCYIHSGFACHQQAKPKERPIKQALVESKDRPFSELTLGQKGLMFYAIGRELFSGQSPSGIYSRAFKICKRNEQVIDTFGEPMKAFGEMTTRGRRRFVRHSEFLSNGVKCIRLLFYLEGPLNKGTVHVEARQDSRGKYQFEYVLIELDSYPHRTIVVEDNR